MKTFIIQTPNFQDKITISEGIVVWTEKSLKWAEGRSEDLLINWLNKTFPAEWQKHEQLELEAL